MKLLFFSMAGGTEQQIFAQWSKQPVVLWMVYVYVYVYVYVCVHAHTSLCAYVVVTSLCQASSSWPGTELGSLEVHIDFHWLWQSMQVQGDPLQGLSLTKETTDQARGAGQQSRRDFPVSTSWCGMSFWTCKDPNSGPHVCTWGLPTNPSPKLCIYSC